MQNKIFDSEFYKKLENISLNIKMLMNEGAAGGRKSKAKGSSVEFSDFREYTVGDDFRRIDWNAYGRFNKLFVKLFMEEREALINIFIDSSGSMNFGEEKKGHMALKLGAVLSYLALNNLDRVCINDIKSSEINQSNSVLGKAVFSRCIEHLENIEFEGETSLISSIKKKSLSSRGLSVIISDFFTHENLEELVKYLIFKKQEVVLIHILSREELQPELHGRLRFIDSETKDIKNVVVTNELIKKYDVRLKEFINGLKELTKKLGASYILAASDEPLEKVVFEKFINLGMIR